MARNKVLEFEQEKEKDMFAAPRNSLPKIGALENIYNSTPKKYSTLAAMMGHAKTNSPNNLNRLKELREFSSQVKDTVAREAMMQSAYGKSPFRKL